jgi:hypothetical protein
VIFKNIFLRYTLAYICNLLRSIIVKVFMRRDIEKVGLSGEMVTVGDGYARNFLLPKGFAVEVTPENESSFKA